MKNSHAANRRILFCTVDGTRGRSSRARRIVGVAVVAACCALLAPAPSVRADDSKVAGLPSLSVMGVDDLERERERPDAGLVRFIDDPLEPANRLSLAVSRPVFDWVVVPVAKGWRWLGPEPIRLALRRFAYNLAYPARVVSLALQAKPRRAAEETARFVVNSTLGVAGLADPASDMGLRTYREDFGQALGRWGVTPGPYLFLPLLGPSSVRDGLGRVVDTVLSPAFYVPGASAGLGLNSLTFQIDGYEALAAQGEIYLPVRALWAVHREMAVLDFELTEEDFAEADPEPSLESLSFGPRRPDFAADGDTEAIEVPATQATLRYERWMQPEPAPLVLLVPGIGAYRRSAAVAGLAEMLFDAGLSVAAVSSPFHHEFISRASPVLYPGYSPDDARALAGVFGAIYQDIADDLSGSVTDVRIAGYSLGGIETLMFSNLDVDLPFVPSRLVAVNPPVDLLYASRRFDAYFDAPLRWPAGDRDRRVRRTLMKAVAAIDRNAPMVATAGPDADLEPADEDRLPFDRDESELLIGLATRALVIEALAAVEGRGGAVLPIEDRGGGAAGTMLESVNQSSFARYVLELLVPDVLESRDAGRSDADEVVAAASLPHHAAALAADARVRVITNADDFLLAPGSIEYLDKLLGDRLTVFERGGHLGNLGHPAFRRAFVGALSGD